MAIYLESFAARYMVGVYLECRNNGTYPAPGPWGSQTAYCAELFSFLDEVVAQTRHKNAQASKPAK